MLLMIELAVFFKIRKIWINILFTSGLTSLSQSHHASPAYGLTSGSIRTPEILRKNRSLSTASAAEQEALRQYVDSLKQANIEKTSENVRLV